ncbi:hypothetical protein O6H91_15G008800 [Diphasiastrum complanatum]|uniref:Uncharacterized protein n=1 Tax=Diphasiastrum complanatum TaxID=34168 RepID=A0ACC2BFQ1_DIPCM|nr:hypothetical protein O6H91_15G008800 [Diphasiastrum complanatum]
MQLCARFSVRSCHSLRLAVPVRSFGTTSPRVWAWKSAAVFGCFPLKSPLAAGITYTSRARSMGTDLRASLARKPCAVAPPPAPNGGKFKVAVCQLSVTANKEQNINHAREVIEGAADEGAELIVLPVTIIGGSIPERSYDHLYNTCCIYGRNGELQAKHRKVHLFDIDIPGKIVFKESETLTAGEGLTVVDTYVGRIGVGICYDIRFEELAMLYAARGAQMICYPGAFNMTTGPLHWELLQRARAIDNQLYVITCSPARDPTASYVAWGHSTVVGPQFGEIISKTGHEEATIFADIDYSVSDQRRLNMPLDKQRRGDLYQLVDVSRCHEGSE